jgi:hypothetical protein
MKLNYVIDFLFFYGKFEVHHIWYQRKSYDTGPEQGHINCLVYILIYEKTNKSCALQTKIFFVLC